MSEQETKRTIDEVIDVETGEIIKAEAFFNKTESEISEYRTWLEQSIKGYRPPKFKCVYCNQLLRLAGNPKHRGKITHFAHLYDSDDCEIKTKGNLSKEEIEALKYGNIRESERHIRLKNEIADLLRSTPNVSNVEIEKRVTSDSPYLFWKRPDVYAEYDGKSIVFELQLSTTFLSVIVERDIFYRFNNTFILWVFNFSDNEQYVNFQNLMIKDIYYANKRNAFVFDENAQQLSKETGELHFLCIWFEPLIIDGEYQKNKGLRKEKYIKLSDLKLHSTTYKPYYVDADALFAEYEPHYFESKIDLENMHKVRLERLAKKNQDKERLKELKQQEINEIKNRIETGEMKLQPFKKSDKWGYLSGDVVVVDPIYSEASGFSECGYAKVKFNRRYGFINKFGEIVTDCIYTECFEIYDKKCVVKFTNDYLILDLDNNETRKIDCTKVDIFMNTKTLLEIIDKKAHKLIHYKFKDTKVISMDGERIPHYVHYKVINEVGLFVNEYYVLIDKHGIETRINDYIEDFDSKFKSVTCIVDANEEILIQPEYELIDNFIDGVAKAKKNGKYGYLDINGKILIPFEFKRINEFGDGRLIASNDDEFAIIDNKGEGIYIFKLENSFMGNYGETITESKFGIKDSKGNVLLPPNYHKIEIVRSGLLKIYRKVGVLKTAKRDKILKYKVGCINESGKIVVPCVFDEISEFIDGKARAKKNGKDLVIDFYGNDIKKENVDVSLYQLNSIHKGKITNIVKYGVFVEFPTGITALLHNLELNKLNQSSSNFMKGAEIEVQILSIDENRNRISLTLPLGRSN
jgi:hypothetical protein